MRLPFKLGGPGLLLCMAGCVSVDFHRSSIHEPIPDQTVHQLAKRESPADLQSCLDVLGAPLDVWQTVDGMAMSYGWKDQTQWSVEVSYAFERFLALRFNFQQTNNDLTGIVLLFDQGHNLLLLRRGSLAQITAETIRRRTPDASGG